MKQMATHDRGETIRCPIGHHRLALMFLYGRCGHMDRCHYVATFAKHVLAFLLSCVLYVVTTLFAVSYSARMHELFQTTTLYIQYCAQVQYIPVLKT